MLRTNVGLDHARVVSLALNNTHTLVEYAGRNRFSVRFAVNPNLEDPRMKPSGGVEIDAIEVAYASAIVAHRVQYELGEKTRLSLRAWVEQELAKREGRKDHRKRAIAPRAQLAGDLLGLDMYDRRHWTAEQTKQFKAEIRKLQEYTQTGDKYAKLPKYANVAGDRRARIANLPGGEAGNPYVPDSTLWTRNLINATLSGGALGDWQISEFVYNYKWKYTLPERPEEDPAPLHEAVEFGAGLVLAIRDGVDQYIGSADRANSLTELIRVYGIVVDVSR